MLLNLIVFKSVPGILKCLDAWWMSFFVFCLFSTVNLYSYIYIYKKIRFRLDSFPIWFDKIGEFNRIYDGTRYLVIFRIEKYDFIYDRIRYLRSIKSGITYIISHNYLTIKVDSYGSLRIEKMALCNVTILVKSVWDKDKNNYYYNILWIT